MDNTATDGQQAGPPLGLGLSEGLSPKLRQAGVWVWHEHYAAPEPAGYTRSSAPFEAADALDMQARQIEQLRAALQAAHKQQKTTRNNEFP